MFAFAGWEADAGLIGRIRATDTTTNFLILLMENLTTEGGAQPVTAPLPGFLLLLGALSLATWRRL